MLMYTFDDTTTTEITDTTGDHLLILDGQQRKKYISDIALSQKSKNLFKRALPKILKKLKK